MDILAAAKRHRMFSPGDLVLVAVSGGPDSVAMLHALHTRSDEFGISLSVAHLNHGIRGEESNSDEVFVRKLAQDYGLPAIIKRVDIPSLRAQMRVGEEEAAREERYKFLRETATNIGANKIAVGHNADDRAESVLLNIIRGAGIDGLGSIRPVRGNIVRPLIDTFRADIEAYVRENGLRFRVDASNVDTTYARNRVRHELLPLIERDYNPKVKSALVHLAKIASNQSEYVHEQAGSAISAISLKGAIDAGLFLEMPRALRDQVLRSEILRQKGDLKDVSFEQVERVIDALSAGGDFTITLPSGEIYAGRRGSEFRVWRKAAPIVAEPFEHVIEVPGTTYVPAIGLTLDAGIEEKTVPRKLPLNEALIDADGVAGCLRVRNARPGDRIVPFGMSSPKKLQDVFVDKKIPREERARSAVIVDDEKVLWVVGVVTAEAARVTDRTRRAVHIIIRRCDIGRRGHKL